jgi:cysteine desulfurase / selenocysteine lyase
MHSYKKDFPLFETHPDLIYLDSASTAQKPRHVIDGMSNFLQSSYANIHRGAYSLSEQSEEAYYASKDAVAWLLNCTGDEIIYTYNSTYAYNMLAQTLWYSWVLKAWDTVLVDIAEHHANIVPWQMLSQRHGITIERLDLDENYDYSLSDFTKKYTDSVKVVSLSAASNVTGTVYDISAISKLLRPETFFIVDGSQSIPHGKIDVIENRIDALIFTGHKIMADTWIGILYLAKKHIKDLSPARWWGGMIEDVTTWWYKATSGRQKFEPGTPHVVGAVSLLKALEYIKNIGWFAAIQQHEKKLIEYTLDRFSQNPKLQLVGKKTTEHRLGIFSFALQGHPNHIQIWERLAQQNICIRAGGHCTHPLFHKIWQNGSCRISIYLYNDISDLEKVFDALENI